MLAKPLEHTEVLINPESVDLRITTRISTGGDARSRIADTGFLQAWRELYELCPWGTVNQSPDFCVPWYEIYERLFEPVIVTGTDASGRVVGLLPLALNLSTGELASAGAEMSEYEVWLAAPHVSDTFIEAALDALSEKFPNGSLRFLFLPPNSPLEWTTSGRRWGRHCALRAIARPLAEVGDGSRFTELLKKKEYRIRINRLKQLGEFRFRRLSTPQELEAVLDEIFDFGNFRLAAFYNTPISLENNQLQKRLYMRLSSIPRLLHVTALSAGDQLISAHIGVYNKEQVLSGLMAFSPFFAKYSPGMLLQLMLGQELAKEGVPVFDLTPGGEYKEFFATHHDTAHVLTVFFNRKRYLQYKAKRMAIDTTKKLLGRAGVAPATVQNFMGKAHRKLRHLDIKTLPSKLSNRLRKTLWYTGELRIYSMDVDAVHCLPYPRTMKRDCIQDLLCYEPAEAWQAPASQFLNKVIKSIRSGAHIYTHAEDGRLLHYGWLIERQTESFLSEVGQTNYMPADSAVLADYYTHPLARGKGLYQASLSQMLHDAASIPNTKRIYIGVMADNGPSRHVIEKLGFVYQYSFFQQRRLARSARWSNAPEWATRPAQSDSAS